MRKTKEEKKQFKSKLKEYKLFLKSFNSYQMDQDQDKLKSMELFNDELIASKKFWYKRLTKKFQQIKYLVNKWNEYMHIISAFSYENYLQNIDHLLPTDEIKNFETLDFLVSNHIINKQTCDFIKCMNEIKIYNDDIKQQYKLFKQYSIDINDFNKMEYLNQNYQQMLRDKSQKLKEELHKYKKCFYDFNIMLNIETFIRNHNLLYLQASIRNDLFDNINGKSLDKEQREAILKDENALLVIAGAGSGKTLTICGKIKYLLEKEHINPNDILCLSYSVKSVNDLRQKLNLINSELEVSTFHSLGLKILNTAEHKVQNVDDQFDNRIEEYFRTEITSKPEMMKKVIDFCGLYLNNYYKGVIEEQIDAVNDSKSDNFKTQREALKSLGNTNNKITLKKEKVKSYEELIIANYYFINGINYEYEQPYKIDLGTSEKRQYKPDFYLRDYDIYHEHYGIDKNGRNGRFSETENIKYNEIKEWKEQIHLQYKTKCINTFSYEFKEGNIFKHLDEHLQRHNVKFRKLNDAEILDCWNSNYQGWDFSIFIHIMKHFLSLYKGKYENEYGFNELLKKCSYNSDCKRTTLFLEIAKDIYLYYKNLLNSLNRIDFDDMILKSINVIKTVDKSLFNYKYIIVDEFQDISHSRIKLLKNLIHRSDAKLFAAGDDWQSIYSFNGCDINIFLDFKHHFPSGEISKITTTYRNSQELQDIAVYFVTKNQNQIKKNIKSNITLENPIKVAFYYENKMHQCLDYVLDNIELKNPNASVLLLGRNNSDIEYYLNEDFKIKGNNNSKIMKLSSNKYKDFDIKFATVHGSKGLEDEFVVIINANDAATGFPNKIEDDSIINLVLDKAQGYDFDEERRLWYVALTRTKSYTYVIADMKKPSVFLREIYNACDIIFPQEKKNSQNIITKLKSFPCKECNQGELLGNFFKDYYKCNMCRCTIKATDLINPEFCGRCGDYLIWYEKKDGSHFQKCRSYKKCQPKQKSYNYKYTSNKKFRKGKKAFYH
ncbi:UvrD-helicase domain-containing protein [Mycoplasma sp. Z244C]